MEMIASWFCIFFNVANDFNLDNLSEFNIIFRIEIYMSDSVCLVTRLCYVTAMVATARSFSYNRSRGKWHMFLLCYFFITLYNSNS